MAGRSPNHHLSSEGRSSNDPAIFRSARIGVVLLLTLGVVPPVGGVPNQDLSEQMEAVTLQKANRVYDLDDQGKLTRAQEVAVNAGVSKALDTKNVTMLAYQYERDRQDQYDRCHPHFAGKIPPMLETGCSNFPVGTPLLLTRDGFKAKLDEKCRDAKTCAVVTGRLNEILDMPVRAEALAALANN